jgi:DNA-binding HxlR family transcriptional regulator
MTEARWKLVVDQDGMTIAGDRFQLTTAAQEFAVDDTMYGVAESPEMEAILAELESMTRRTYGQYCGLARAMEVLGERWAPLIIRDLLVSPKDFADLRAGLPRIPEDVLSARLRELERTGVVKSFDTKYELTDYGRQLDNALVSLSTWGAQMMGDPRPEDVFTASALILALRAAFQPEQATGVSIAVELRAFDYVVHARISKGVLRTGLGSLDDADLVLETGFEIKQVLTGELSPTDAILGGEVRLIGGDRALFPLFVSVFQPGSETAAAA